MRKFAIFCALLIGVVYNADAATARNPRGGTVATTGGAASTGTRSTTARSATTARAATATRGAAPAAATTARAATAGRTTVSRGPVATTSSSSSGSGVARSAVARAGATQKVISTGTKVATANENVVVSQECRQKYYGCMDSFCMLDNDNGGRCICSDRSAELDSILAQIEELDQQSYQMATYGVERIEMGDAAETAIANANAVAQAILDEQENGPLKLPDLNTWMTPVGAEEEDIFEDVTNIYQSPVEGKEGDALYSASHDICAAQIPECEAEMDMLQLMYSQQIRSDCTAYENSLKQQRNASAQKLYTAEQALRSAALEQYQNANKYDLGQCVIEFKTCMIETGECGDDFSGCASIAAFDETNTRGAGDRAKPYKIQGSATSIEIKASTYDILLSKKPLCESVTKQCVAANEADGGDQVWMAFLREVAPQVKSAELIAEDNVRQNCIGNISSCFQQACKDTMDPNDPDGSYDMCLTRPQTMFSLCTVPLNACGISAEDGDADDVNDPNGIWDFVLARLASMRVNSCTDQVKQCLQSEDRCGSDYTQCIGLDTDTIVHMCPEELLVGCQTYDGGSSAQTYGNDEEDFYAKLEPMIQGILLNIDNSLLEECQRAADEAMITVCGSTENCDNMTVDEYIGANTLEYKICRIIGDDDSTDIDYNNCYTDLSQISDTELGLHDLNKGADGVRAANERIDFAIIIEGEMPWENVIFDENGKIAITSIDPDTQNQRKIESELATLQNNINNAINAIESNPDVQFCTVGRIVQGVNDDDVEVGRTPQVSQSLQTAQRLQPNAQVNPNAQLVQTARSVSDRTATQVSALDVAVNNQTIVDRSGAGGRFPGLTMQMRTMIATSAINRAIANYRAKYQELEERRMQDYVTLNERMAEIDNENTLEARREAARMACIGTAGASTFSADAFSVKKGRETAKGDVDSSLVGKANDEYVGTEDNSRWNYREVITSTFNPSTLVCNRCTRTQNCADPKGGRKLCKRWSDPVETCEDIQF